MKTTFNKLKLSGACKLSLYLGGIKILSKINGNKYSALRRCITLAASEKGIKL
jgi:hypothetical protein